LAVLKSKLSLLDIYNQSSSNSINTAIKAGVQEAGSEPRWGKQPSGTRHAAQATHVVPVCHPQLCYTMADQQAVTREGQRGGIPARQDKKGRV
jgi:hypothetical protein